MAVVRCKSCEGRKSMVGLGGMKKTCDVCKGIGHVKADVPGVDVVVKRKRRSPDEMKAAVKG